MAINDGSIVWLKTGGPAMTVKYQDSFSGEWLCSWFVGTQVQEHAFMGAQLTEQDPNPNYSNLPMSGGH